MKRPKINEKEARVGPFFFKKKELAFNDSKFLVLSTGLETSAEDEKNLLYVAMTRAKKYLAINSSILNLLCSVHHNFEKVRISDHDDNADTATASASVCVECKDSRRDDRNLFVLERPSKFFETFFATIRSRGYVKILISVPYYCTQK